MTTTTQVLRGVSERSSGINQTNSLSSYAIFTPWRVILPSSTSELYIYGLAYEVASILSADSTVELLFELGFGQVSNAVTQVQIPISMRNDTAVGYYLNTQSLFLPEPKYVPPKTKVVFRFTTNTAITLNGIKLRIMSNTAPLQPDEQNTLQNFMNSGFSEKAFN